MGSQIYFILAAIQGVTEFLPVSSSGHLVMLEQLLMANVPGTFFFNIVIHLSTLLATITFYRHDIWSLTYNGLQEIVGKAELKRHRKPTTSEGISPSGKRNYPVLIFGGKIFLTTLVTGGIGILAKPWVAGFQHLGFLALFFFLTGIILTLNSVKNTNHLQNSQEMNVTDNGASTIKLSITTALVIGLAQGLAVFPGISRSGITITTGILWGLESREAMKYSIFISIPVIIAAFCLEFSETIMLENNKISFWVYLIAFFISYGIGYISLYLLYRIVRRQRIQLFAFYLIPLSLVLGMYYLISI